MKVSVLTGIVLIILGVAALVYHGITSTPRAKVLQLEPLEARQETEGTIPVLPVLGGAAITAGCVWMLIGTEKT